MEIDELFSPLSITNVKDVCKSLKKLQRCLKKGEFRRQFIENDGINHFSSGLSSVLDGLREQHQLGVTSLSSSRVDNNTIDRLVLVGQILSCLTKLTTGNRFCMLQFLKANGLKILEEALLYCPNEITIRNTCLLIANAAEETTITHDIATALINIIQQYNDTQLAVTILRTLWTICSSLERICTIVTADGFPSVVKLLSSEDERKAKASMRLVNKLLRGSNNEQITGLRVLESDGFQLLLALMHRKLSENDLCLISDCLYYMIGIPQVRVSENCTTFINFCAIELTRSVDSKRFQNAFLSLCLCAMEAINRSKMRCAGVLDQFVRFLGQSEYSQYHFQIVSTFVCFLFDDPSLYAMLHAGLLPSLLKHLEGTMKLQSEGCLQQFCKMLLPNFSPFMSPGAPSGPPSADGSSPNIHGARGPFHDVMLLLEKLSSTSAISLMVSRTCIDPILKYLSTSEQSGYKAVKILVRISENPQFFESLLKLDVIPAIYFQLKKGCSIAHLEGVVTQVATKHSTEEIMLCFDMETISFSGFAKACGGSSDKQKEDSSIERKIEDKEFIMDDFRIRRQGDTLFHNLRRHGESPFGQGVLAHALLTDLTEVKETFSIGYCYFCRPSPFRKRMLIDLKGLDLIANFILRMADDEAKLCQGFLALFGLAKSLGLTDTKSTVSPLVWDTDDFILSRFNLHEGNNTGDDSKAREVADSDEERKELSCCMFSKLFCTRPLETTSFPSKLSMNTVSPLEPPNTGCDNVCFYLEDCVIINVNRGAILSASPVFAAMLSSSFVDSSLPYVSLKDVNATSFILLLHHIRGCTIDLESLSCVSSCKFDGTVQISDNKNGADSCKESSNLVKEPNVEDTKCSETSSVDVEENKRIVDDRDVQKLESNECQSKSSVSESNCVMKTMSEEQKLCLVTDIMRISDRFLLDDVRGKCEDYLTKKLSDETVALIYMEALLCQAQALATSCVKYLLTEIKDPVKYLKAVTLLFKSADKIHFIDELKSVLESRICYNKPKSNGNSNWNLRDVVRGHFA